MRNEAQILAAMVVMAAATLVATGAVPGTQNTSQADYAAEFEQSQHYAGPRTQENLDRLKKALEVPETRMTALRELIDFAGMSMYQVGSVFPVYSDDSMAIRREAAKAGHGAADDATILKALNGSDALLIFWGIWHFQGLKDQKGGMAILRRLAQGKDETLRSRAAETLVRNGDREVAAQLAAKEKSPWVLDDLLFRGEPAGAAAMNRRLEELLKDPDAEVRTKVLGYIGANWISAAARQLYVDAPLMDAVLACAQGKQADAGTALETFRSYTDQPQLADADAATKWWKERRDDWELARFPRWLQPNGSQIYASIVTTGQVGGKPEWQAAIILENHSKQDIYVNLAEIAKVAWILYDDKGQRVPTAYKNSEAVPEWLDMKPGQSVKQISPIVIKPEMDLKPGRYTLHAWMYLGTDTRGLPKDVPLYGGEIPFPAIKVEVAGAAK